MSPLAGRVVPLAASTTPYLPPCMTHRPLLCSQRHVRLAPAQLRPPGHGQETIVIYCDGAALRNGTSGASAGYGVCFQKNCYRYLNRSGPVEGPQTNQRAELTALLFAIRSAPPDTHLVIFTDSRYAINCLTDWVNRWQRNDFINARGVAVVNEILIRDVMEAREAHDGKVRLQYVPGHSGNYGNDQADRLARMAAIDAEQDF